MNLKKIPAEINFCISIYINAIHKLIEQSCDLGFLRLSGGSRPQTILTEEEVSEVIVAKMRT